MLASIYYPSTNVTYIGERNIKILRICLIGLLLVTAGLLNFIASQHPPNLDKINWNDLRNKTVVWGNLAINDAVKVHNDLVDNETIEEPDLMMRDLGAYNLVYNNSATNGIDNLKITYITDFQKRKNIKIKRLIINIPRNYIKENPDLTKLTGFIDDAKLQNIEIYGFLFDDYSDGLLTENELRHTVSAIKNKDANIKIIGVLYYKDILKTLIEREEFPNDVAGQAFTHKLLLANEWFDEYTIWYWNPSNSNFEFLLNEAEKLFPTKPISLGVYINDYSGVDKGAKTNANPVDINIFVGIFTEATRLVNSGKAKDLYIISSYWYSDTRFEELRKFLCNAYENL